MNLNLRFTKKRGLRFLQWKELASADGYQIEQRKHGKWQHFVWIRNPHLTECSVYTNEKKEEKFRVTAYKLDENNEEVFIGYDQIVLESLAQRIKLPVMSKLTIGGRAYSALRINWVVDPNAEGYILEQKVKDEWIRLDRIADNTIHTYRVEKLKPATTYKFRMRAFTFDESTPVYSDYESISGTTLGIKTTK